MPKEEDRLPQVPPKPDITGMQSFPRNKALKKYYDDNAVDILADRERIGDVPAKKRWGFSDFGWRVFKERHGIPVPKRVPRKPKVVTPEGERPEEPSAEAEPEAEKTPEPDAAAEEEKVFIYTCANCLAHFDNREALIKHVKLHFKPVLPDFPAFDPKWKKEVQVEWLRAYAKMAAPQENNHEPD